MACSLTAPASWLFAACSIANWHFILEHTIYAPNKVKAKVEVEAYMACSLTAPASWLSAAYIIANWHFIPESIIHTPN
jgi:hypothetical protein